MIDLVRNTIIVLFSVGLLWLILVIADILDFPPPPVTEYDEKIIEQTIVGFNELHIWNKQDNRNCKEVETLSLYCALVLASLKVTGEFNNNSAALEQVRNEILSLSKRSDFKHILMDFNNHPDTSIDDIQIVLRNAKKRINKKYKAKNPVIDWLSTLIRETQSN